MSQASNNRTDDVRVHGELREEPDYAALALALLSVLRDIEEVQPHLGGDLDQRPQEPAA